MPSPASHCVKQERSSLSHQTILPVSRSDGNFDRISGAVDLDDRNIAASKVTATIDAASIDTRVQKRDDHLRSPDFFDVAKYPEIIFVSKRWSRTSNGKLKSSPAT